MLLKSLVDEQVLGFGAAAVAVLSRLAAAAVAVAVLGIRLERLLKLAENLRDANKKAIQHKCRDILLDLLRFMRYVFVDIQ